MKEWKFGKWKFDFWWTLAVRRHKLKDPQFLTAHRHKKKVHIFLPLTDIRIALGFWVTSTQKTRLKNPDRLLAENRLNFPRTPGNNRFSQEGSYARTTSRSTSMLHPDGSSSWQSDSETQEFRDWNLSSRGCKLPTAWISSRWDFSERVFLFTQLTLNTNGVLVHPNVP